MRVTLIYRKDQHTDKLGTLELDGPGPLVMVHTEAGRDTCAVYELGYMCHTQSCSCGATGDKVRLVEVKGLLDNWLDAGVLTPEQAKLVLPAQEEGRIEGFKFVEPTKEEVESGARVPGKIKKKSTRKKQGA